jgi:hypothetical protein
LIDIVRSKLKKGEQIFLNCYLKPLIDWNESAGHRVTGGIVTEAHDARPIMGNGSKFPRDKMHVEIEYDVPDSNRGPGLRGDGMSSEVISIWVDAFVKWKLKKLDDQPTWLLHD